MSLVSKIDQRVKLIKENIISYFFSEASQRAGILNPRIWLASRAFVIGPAFYDTGHGPDFYPRYSRRIEIVAKVYKQRQQLLVNNLNRNM